MIVICACLGGMVLFRMCLFVCLLLCLFIIFVLRGCACWGCWLVDFGIVVVGFVGWWVVL